MIKNNKSIPDYQISANMTIDKRLNVPVDFILDDFANCPPLDDISAMVSVARSRGIRLYLYIQSFS